jgi:hypothetical protein
MSDMKEYIVKLTQTEVRAICHGIGAASGINKVADGMYHSLIDLVYNNMNEYVKERRNKLHNVAFTRKYNERVHN